MKTISVKTSELSGAALRYAVAVAAGMRVRRMGGNGYEVRESDGIFWRVCVSGDERLFDEYEPDRDWSQLGPLVERFGVKLGPKSWPVPAGEEEWFAVSSKGGRCFSFIHQCPLIAACRAIAAAHWGEYADIPEELVEPDK